MRARSILLAGLVLCALIGAWWLMQRAAPEAGVAGVLNAPAPPAHPAFEALAPDALAVQLPRVESVPVGNDTGSVSTLAELVPPDDATCIAGTVAYTTGEPVGPGVHVVAWPVDEPLAPDIGTGLWPPEHCVETDEGSAFRIDALQPHVRYTVCAVGLGLYTPFDARSHGADAGTTDLQVLVARVYGVHVVLRDEHGEPLRTHRSLGRQTWDFADGAKANLPRDAPLIGRIGLRDEDLAPWSCDNFVLLCLGGADTPPPVGVSGGVAGYASYSREVPLAPVSAGLATVEIRLEQLCKAFGRLTVECIGAGPKLDDAAAGGGTRRAGLILELAPAEEQNRMIGYPLLLEPLPWDGVTLENIPAGRYWVRLGSRHKFFPTRDDLPARDVEILPGDNRLSIDVGTTGAVELLPRRADGRPWTGEARFRMSSEVRGFQSSHPVYFREAPYVLEGLPTGRYHVELSTPFHAVVGADPEASVLVDGSRLQSVALQQD